ncbi:MAG: hypothetical protein D3923_10355 [Candidatus Electrothrix sp. AR3]|nr:hypothetical protein [Candidatus Electrothrix sp. AR3]
MPLMTIFNEVEYISNSVVASSQVDCWIHQINIWFIGTRADTEVCPCAIFGREFLRRCILHKMSGWFAPGQAQGPAPTGVSAEGYPGTTLSG